MKKTATYLNTRAQFLLRDTHEYKLVCDECITPVSNAAPWRVTISKPDHEGCENFILIVQSKDQVNSPNWIRIKEISTKIILGEHRICRDAENCRSYEDCQFCHSEEERLIWNEDHKSHFFLSEFIFANSTALQNAISSNDLSKVAHWLVKKIGGIFKLICQQCYSTNHEVIPFSPNSPCHVCHQQFAPLLYNSTVTGNSTKPTIMTCQPLSPLTELPPRIQLCPKYPRCNSKGCKYPHFHMERDIWVTARYFRDNGIELGDDLFDTIVTVSQQIISATIIHSKSLKSKREIFRPNSRQRAKSLNVTSPLSENNRKKIPKKKKSFPFDNIVAYCSVCYYKRQIYSPQCYTDDKVCSSEDRHLWASSGQVIIFHCHKLVVIRNPPKRQEKYVICKNIDKCPHKENCHNAHSSVELQIWDWMKMQNIFSMQKILQSYDCESNDDAIIKAHENSMRRRRNCSLSVENAASEAFPVSPIAQSFTLFRNEAATFIEDSRFCEFCCQTLMGDRQWLEHCASRKHTDNAKLDANRSWNYRAPVGKTKELALCQLHASGGRCRYSNKPLESNYCSHAHSQEELDEWKERLYYRKMHESLQNQGELIEHVDRVTANYQLDGSYLRQSIDGVEYSCDNKFAMTTTNKEVDYSWNIRIKSSSTSDFQPKRVILLSNDHRHHFRLIDGDDTAVNLQMMTIDSSTGCLDVHVQFHTETFGSFYQWVVVESSDTASPCLCISLRVDSGTEEILDKIKGVRSQISNAKRWRADEMEVVRYDEPESVGDREIEDISMESKVWSAVNQSSLEAAFTAENYIEKMHHLLNIEELYRDKEISGYDFTDCNSIQLDILGSIQTMGLFLPAPAGQLFARVKCDNLSDDTDAGHLLLTTVNSVWLTPYHQQTGDAPPQLKKVYEALVVDSERFGLKIRGRDHIYLSLSQNCVDELKWKAGDQPVCELQFQMNRSLFFILHKSLENLPRTFDRRPFVFPNINLIPPFIEIPNLCKDDLNDDQFFFIQKALQSHKKRATPVPIVICGAFGSGKTKTLANIVIQILRMKPTAKILVCSHNNSAADLFIINYFHPQQIQNVVRLYYKNRRVDRNDPHWSILQNYVLLSADSSRYREVTLDDMNKASVMVTTLLTSYELRQMNNEEGFYDYIVIDEASQVMEAEILIPLRTAGVNTSLILAGDPHQMSPEVFSSDAGRGGLYNTLLDRLMANLPRDGCSRFLSHVYRTHPTIVRFLSTVFYQGPESLRSFAIASQAPGFAPLSLYSIYDKDPHSSVTGESYSKEFSSWYNICEMMAIVQQVEELRKCWPIEEWGPLDLSSICVVSPFYYQVVLIRQELRKKRLSKVVVEKMAGILNKVQGQEFRAVFISPVLTRDQFLNSPSTSPQSNTKSKTYGSNFHTNSRLINTAISRAKSLVQVVGDPVGLQLHGSCQTIWKEFVKHCSENALGLQPLSAGLSKQRLDALVEHVQIKKTFSSVYNDEEPLNSENKPAPDNIQVNTTASSSALSNLSSVISLLTNNLTTLRNSADQSEELLTILSSTDAQELRQLAERTDSLIEKWERFRSRLDN